MLLSHTPCPALGWAGNIQQYWLRCPAEAYATSSDMSAAKTTPLAGLLV